jgi:hypothetical protein
MHALEQRSTASLTKTGAELLLLSRGGGERGQRTERQGVGILARGGVTSRVGSMVALADVADDELGPILREDGGVVELWGPSGDQRGSRLRRVARGRVRCVPAQTAWRRPGRRP